MEQGEILTDYVAKKIKEGYNEQHVRYLSQMESYLMHGTLTKQGKEFLERLKEEYPEDYKAIKEELEKKAWIEKQEEEEWNLERKMRKEK